LPPHLADPVWLSLFCSHWRPWLVGCYSPAGAIPGVIFVLAVEPHTRVDGPVQTRL